jgi:hypothetical protein
MLSLYSVSSLVEGQKKRTNKNINRLEIKAYGKKLWFAENNDWF